MEKIFLLNGGKDTTESFASGLNKKELISLKTKETILHIKQDLSINFINSGEIIDFNNSFVFTRLRAHDSLFSGILYEHLYSQGIPASDIINLSFKFSEEKIAQMARLARAGIQIPDTIVAREESYECNKEYIKENISFPLVYKTDGSKGNAVHLVNSQKELDIHITNKEPKEIFILQEVIPNTYDTRTLVAFGNILGSIKRSAAEGQFLNNVSQGGSVTGYSLTEEEEKLAIKATEVVGLDFGGVDIIHTEKGPYILEVNKAPQINGFESIYGEKTVFKRIAQIIEAGTETNKNRP